MRVQYVDFLKAVTIIFVVMGHVAEKSVGITNSPFNMFYSSFHMPLFMFLSGMFAYKHISSFDIGEFYAFVRKKALRILLPLIIVGGGYTLVYKGVVGLTLGIDGGYWFLSALFLVMMLGFIAFALSHRMVRHIVRSNTWSDLLSLFFVYAIFCGCYIIHLPIPYLLAALKMFPFFIAGHYFANSQKFADVVMSDTAVGVSIMAYTVLFIIGFNPPIAIKAFFAIVVIIKLTRMYESRLPRWITMIGRHSLEIYIFHWFFIPSLSSIHPFLTEQHSNGTLDNGNFVLLLSMTFLAAVPIILCCLFISKTLHSNTYTEALVFGNIKKTTKER